MIRPLALLLALAAPAAQACAVAEGCPMGLPPADPCATVRLREGFVCVPDPSAPGGFAVVPAAAPGPPSIAEVGQGLGAALALPLVGLIGLLSVASDR